MFYIYGIVVSGSLLDMFLEIKLVILWGYNLMEIIFGYINYFLQKMKQNGMWFIVVDLCYFNIVLLLVDQWILLLFIIDNVLMDVMMYVIISENLYDCVFIVCYVIGFDEDLMLEGVLVNELLVVYLIGVKDGVVKFFEWVEKIIYVLV